MGPELDREPPRPDRARGVGTGTVVRAPLATGLEREVVARLSEKVGNRQVARLVGPSLQVARTPAATALPALSDAAVRLLSDLGLTEAQASAFGAGELIAFQMAVPGNDPTIGLLQLQPNLVRGGIFDINVPTDTEAAVKSFFQARGVVLKVARAVNAPEIELIGASVRNKDVAEMLGRLKFTRTTQVVPETAGLGPTDTVEIYTKRFPVGGTPAAEPAPPGAPPAGPAPAAPPAAAPPTARPLKARRSPARGPVRQRPPPRAQPRPGQRKPPEMPPQSGSVSGKRWGSASRSRS